MTLWQKAFAYSLLPAILFWLLDSVLDSIVAPERAFWQLLATGLHSHDLQMRIVVVVGCIALGIVMAGVVYRQCTAEEALRESKERYGNLFYHSNDAIFLHDLAGNIIDVNQRTLDLFGYTKPEIMELNIRDLHPDDSLQKSRNAFDKIPTDRFVSFEIDFIKKNRAVFSAEVSSSLFEAGGGKVIQGIVRDVTERKKAEKKLKESEARKQALLDAIPDLMFQMGRDGTFLGHKGARKDLYMEPDEFLGKKVSDLLPPEIAEPTLRHIKLALGTGRIQIYEYKLEISGELRHFEVRMVANGENEVLAIIRNITVRKRAEEALRASEELLRATVESTADGILVVDDKGKVIHSNAQFANMWRIPEDLIVTGDDDKLLKYVLDQLEDPEAFLSKVKRLYHSPEKDFDGLRFKDGRIFERFSCPLYQGDRIAGRVWSFRDVTETRRLQDLASRAQRLETAGRIAGQVAHDFNNLLGPQVAFPELIRDELPADHPVLKYVNSMEKSATKMADINQQLLTLGRRGHYDLLPVNLNDIVREAIGQYEDANKKIEFASELSQDLLNVNVGPAQIHRVICNLVVNAIDAMPDGGVLKLKTENFYVDSPFGTQMQIPKGEYVKLTVSDTGCGIPAEVQKKMFDPFFTTKATDRRHGSGLGLSVVHAVVKDHNGFIDYSSEINEGSSFFLYLPITREDIRTADESNIVGGEEKILVVDDDPEQLDVTRRLLEKLGYEIRTAGSGEEAVNIIRKSRHDLLLLDMVMPPGIDGAETFRRALEIDPSQQAVVVSGYAHSDRVKMALRLGASEYIRKPLNLKSVASAVRKALDKKQEAVLRA